MSIEAARPYLLDEKARPDFRSVYGELIRGARAVDVAIRKIRLSGLSLDPGELEGPDRIRVLLSEINVLSLGAEAEAMAADRDDRVRLEALSGLLGHGRVRVRSAPLAGWAPDFSLFHRASEGPVLLVGPHWFARPFPHRGPALASVHSGRDASRIVRRFEALWKEGHAVADPIRRVLGRALERVGVPEPGEPGRTRHTDEMGGARR